jgi:flagellar motor switch protein FliN/FliY
MSEEIKDNKEISVEDVLKEERFDDISSINEVPVNISAVLGKSRISIGRLLKLGKGAVLELDRSVGEPIDILVNNKTIAKGEVIVLDEGQLGIAITETFKAD